MQAGVTLIGPVSSDTVRLPGHPERQQPGGGVFYAGMALRALDVPVTIISKLAAKDETALLTPLRQAGAAIHILPSRYTTGFINIYGPATDERKQQVTACADPFILADLPPILTQWVYFAPLLETDISVALIRRVADRGAHRIALDAQGLLRRVAGANVLPTDCPVLYEILPHIDILKADADEAGRITGQGDPEMAARILCGRGVDHALVTLGGAGAILCHRGLLVRQPAFRPADQHWPVIDTTGCGDTFLAAYLASIVLGRQSLEAGHFAAKAAALKLTTFGPLSRNVHKSQLVQLTIVNN